MTKANTPFGIVSKLKEGSYRLRNPSTSIACLKESKESTFHFLADVGFVIKSCQYILKAEDEYKKTNSFVRVVKIEIEKQQQKTKSN